MPAPRGSAPPRHETPPERPEKRFRVGVFGLTAAVAAFLLARLHAWPPNEDETLVFFVGSQPLGDLLHTVIAERGGAPLHFLLAHLALLAWPSLTSLRLVSVVFVVASIPVIAALVSRLSDRRTALLATLLVAASWTTLFHGIYARMYGLFLFLGALSFLLLLRAVERDSWRRWTAWALAALALIATQPYGALVLVVQGLYVLARARRLRAPLRRAGVAFLVVAIASTPLWLTYARLASRFDVGPGGGGGSELGSLDLLAYLWSALGDFTAGWPAVSIPIALLAFAGLARLALTRPSAAFLAVAVVTVPALALLVTRPGSGVFVETRHLVFALPFLAMAVAEGILGASRLARSAAPLAVAVAAALLVSSELAWGWSRTPWLYTGEPERRAEARTEAAAWLAATGRASDVLFGYEPTYLDAWKAGAPFGDLFVPRADPRLAIRMLREAGLPLGRGVWVLDASDEREVARVRLEIPEAAPSEEFESRAFGPFLVIRTKEPPSTVEEFFEETLRVQELARRLEIGDAGVNLSTARTALRLLGDP